MSHVNCALIEPWYLGEHLNELDTFRGLKFNDFKEISKLVN